MSGIAIFAALILTAATAVADVKVKVASSQTLGEAPFYVAIEKGYFAEEGLDVELVPARAGPDALSMVASGAVDVATTIPGSGLYNAFQHGVPLKLVAGASYTIAALVARGELVESGKLNSFADLQTHSLALPSPVSVHHMWVAKGAEQAGVDPKDIKLVYMPFPEMMGALASGNVDIAYLPEPFAANAVGKLGAKRWFDPNTLMPDTVVTAWIYSERIAAKEPELGRKFMVALLRGTRDFLEGTQKGKGREAVVAALIKHTRVKDPALYDQIEYPAVAPNGELGRESLVEMLDWLVQQGHVRTRPDLDKIIDTSFAEYAVQKLGRYEP